VTKNVAAPDGIRAVVTGGSRGLGRALARALAQAGADVIITGRDRTALEETLHLIAAAGGRAHAKLLDIRDEDKIRLAASAFAATHGPIVVVFANAGISLVKPAVEATAAEFRGMFDVNVLGTFAVLQAFGRQMLERGRGYP
jgi:NAD(P)-dependent dehydrogenase (short-subunit alcohol dehydrogenase family)